MSGWVLSHIVYFRYVSVLRNIRSANVVSGIRMEWLDERQEQIAWMIFSRNVISSGSEFLFRLPRVIRFVELR